MARPKTQHQPPQRCLNCGYDLRGLPHHRCPECGHNFAILRVLGTSLPVKGGRFFGYVIAAFCMLLCCIILSYQICTAYHRRILPGWLKRIQAYTGGATWGDDFWMVIVPFGSLLAGFAILLILLARDIRHRRVQDPAGSRWVGFVLYLVACALLLPLVTLAIDSDG